MSLDLVDWLDAGDRRSRTETHQALASGADWARQAGWLVDDGHLDAVRCEACDRDHYAKVSISGEAARAYCPDDGWSTLRIDDVAAVSLDLSAFIASMAASLDLDLPRVPWRVLGQLAELGTAEIKGAMRTLFFVRGLRDSSGFDLVVQTLDEKGSQYSGLVLTCSQVPLSIRTRWGHRFVPLQEILRLEAEAVIADWQALADWSAGLPVRYKAEGSDALRWKQVADEAWQHLHVEETLTENIAQMGRDVRQLLSEWYPGIELPSPKTMSDHLRRRHRDYYPLKRGRRR